MDSCSYLSIYCDAFSKFKRTRYVKYIRFTSMESCTTYYIIVTSTYFSESPEESPVQQRTTTANLYYELLQYPTENGDTTVEGTMLRSESKRKSIKAKRGNRRALYLDEGQVHTVWKPKRFARKVHVAIGVRTSILEMEKHRLDLHERQQKLLSRVQATREVLKVQREELANLEPDQVDGDEWILNGQTAGRKTATERRKWREVIARVMDENDKLTRRERRNRKKRSMYFHNTVSLYVAAMTKQSPQKETGVVPDSLNKRIPSSHSLKMAPLRTTVMPLRQWRSLLFEDHHRVTANNVESNYSNHDYEGLDATEDYSESAGGFDGPRITASEGNLTMRAGPLTTQLSLGPDIP